MAADWIGIDSSNILAGGVGTAFCGVDYDHNISEALDGSDYWQHDFDHTHWFIVDLGVSISITKVKARSNVALDPTNVNIYISDDTGDWGTAVATGISTWRDTTLWVEIEAIGIGRYVKVEITITEDTEQGRLGFGSIPPTTIFDIYGEVAPITITPSTLDLGLMLEVPSLAFDFTLIPNTLALALTLQTPTISLPIQTILPSTLELALILETPTILLSGTVAPNVLALALTLEIPSVSRGIVIIPDVLELALVLEIPNIIIDETITPSTLDLGLTLEIPNVIIITSELPSELQLEVTLHTPRIIISHATIPPFMHKDLIDPYSGGAWLWLCEIVVSGYDTQRIARNTEDVPYGGKTYDEFNFQVGEQMFSGDGTIPRITLRIFQDRNRIIEDIINETEGALGASVKLIRVNENFLDTPVAALEADYDNLAAESDSEWVTFTLGVPNPLTQRFPLRPYSASVCPWATPTLFKGPECQYVGAETTCTGTYDDCLTNKDNAIHWGAELGLDPNVVRI